MPIGNGLAHCRNSGFSAGGYAARTGVDLAVQRRMDDMGCTHSIERHVPIDTLQCGVLFLLSVGFVASSVCV